MSLFMETHRMEVTEEMAAESKNDVKDSVTTTDTVIKKTKKKKGLLSRLWGAIFRLHGDDFEKRLQYISKEEAAVLSRITRRSQSWRRMNRHLIIFSVLFENGGFIISQAIAVGYAIMTTRSLDLNWKMRAYACPTNVYAASIVFPYLLLPSEASQGCVVHCSGMTLIQQPKPPLQLCWRPNWVLILVLKYMWETSLRTMCLLERAMMRKLQGLADYEIGNHPLAKNSTMQNPPARHTEEEMLDGADMSQQRQMVVEHHPQAGLSTNDGGWIARLAALLVGEDPTQSYALICGNCHMHNGLARKEDFPYVTYYCPHCNALNRPKQPDERVSGANSPAMTSTVEDAVPSAGGSIADKISASNSPVAAVVRFPKAEVMSLVQSIHSRVLMWIYTGQIVD
ncbi:hypothetical protein DH2020_009778 [Rehmannia glutinosa]|uniref:Lunapark zinc ribbon domain-containing protein n=1 Tax=Rehmannia glutinosa TaxID=99300 RepID=A0ABR0X9S0_REHGL